MERAYERTDSAIRELSSDELSTAELEEVAGGFVEIVAYAAGSTYLYYQWLKANHKI